MTQSLMSGISGLQNFQERMDVIGNNIANVNTTGFKAGRTVMTDSFSNTLQSATGSSGVQVGTGVATNSIQNLFTQGSLASTGKNTDLAISGDGFFMVKDPQSAASFATRAGEFELSNEGYLIMGGMRLQGYMDEALKTVGDLKVDAKDRIAANLATANQALTDATSAKATAATAYTTANTACEAAKTDYATKQKAADDAPTDDAAKAAALEAKTALATAQTALDGATATKTATETAFTVATAKATAAVKAGIERWNVDDAGKINIFLSDGTSFVRGQVLLQNFRNPQALAKDGNNLYSNLDAAGPVTGSANTLAAPGTFGLGSVQGGQLELANVDLTNEFSTMITTQRAFQAAARIVTTTDEILQELINLKR